MFLQFLYLFLLLTANFLLLFVRRLRFGCQCVFQFSDKRSQCLGRELDCFGFCCFVLCYNLVYLLQQDAYFFLKFCPVLFCGLTPDEGVFVGFGLYLCPVDILHVQCDKTSLGQQQHNLCEDIVYFFFHSVAEPVDGHEVGTFLCRQPYIVDVALNLTLYLPAGVDVVHVGVQNDF